MTPAQEAEMLMLLRRIDAKLDRLDERLDAMELSFERIESNIAAFQRWLDEHR